MAALLGFTDTISVIMQALGRSYSGILNRFLEFRAIYPPRTLLPVEH
jgi:hypothetical protein